MNTIKDSLIASGFDPSMADIYLALAEAGETTVGKLVEKTSLSRAGAYDALNYLLGEKFVEYRKEGRNAYYKLAHPEKLRDLLAERKREVKTLEDELGNTIKSVTGMYNLSQNKPGVRFFEGKEQIIEAYEILLDRQQPIDSFEDKGEMMEFFPDYVQEFIKKRVERKIPLRAIVPNANKINDPNPIKFLDARFIPVDRFPFTMDIKICGDVVQLVTLKKDHCIAVQVHDPLITANFKILFNYIWDEETKKLSSIPTAKPASPIS